VASRDFRDEIPQRAFINAQILQRAVASGEMRCSADAICESYSLHSYSPLDHAHAAGLLYCLVVVPRELWWSSDLLTRLEAHNPLALFSIKSPSTQAQPHTVEALIRHLRNSVAHADFSVAGDGTFTFRDGRSPDKNKHFLAEITLPSLTEFLSIVGAEMANAGNRPT
jgi:hypothetical protein